MREIRQLRLGKTSSESWFEPGGVRPEVIRKVESVVRQTGNTVEILNHQGEVLYKVYV